MRLSEYLPVAIARLCAFVRPDLDAGDPAAALASLQKLLTLIEQVFLDSASECPPLEPPATTGDTRWDTLISASLVEILGQQWAAPSPLPEPWFPMGETGTARALTIAATPPLLADAKVFISRHALRWTRPIL